MRLRNKAIVVTGSSTGIGEAMVRRFVAEGAQVLVHGRKSTEVARVASELGKAAASHVDDLADPDAAPRIVAAALNAFGRIDGLVNNAALTTRRTLADTDAAFFDEMFAVNLRAPLLLVRAAVDSLAKTEGVVLNVGSVLAYCGLSNLLAYSVSKGGLMTLTRNLADTLGPRRIRVNQINVGWTLTPNEYQVKLADGLPEGWPDQVAAATRPFGRLKKPEEVASFAVHWLGEESWPISGSVVDVEQYPLIGRIPQHEHSGPPA